MSEKVKVSREISEALDTVLPNGNISGCIEAHVKGWDYHPKKRLNNLTTEEFARCCLVGYEVEQTPEEELAKHYKECKYSRTADDQIYANGIKKAVDVLGLQITGINK